MEKMHELDTALLQAMGAIETVMARPSADFELLSRVRYQTAQAVAARRRAIDRIVEDALAEGGSRAEMARALRDGGVEMRMVYSNHVTSWPLSRAMAEWPAYLAASKRLGEAMRRQIEIERTQLYPDLPPIAAD